MKRNLMKASQGNKLDKGCDPCFQSIYLKTYYLSVESQFVHYEEEHCLVVIPLRLFQRQGYHAVTWVMYSAKNLDISVQLKCLSTTHLYPIPFENVFAELKGDFR